MRRTVAILALLATSWPHAVVLECALGSLVSPADHTGHGGSATAQHAAHGAAQRGPAPGAAHHGLHGAHHVPERATSEGSAVAGPQAVDHGAPADSAACPMVMACGLVMIQSADAPLPVSAASAPDLDPSPSLGVPSATDLCADPPPPRRHA